MAWLDYNTIQDDLVNLLTANVTVAGHDITVKKEADERDYAFQNMPLIDVRLAEDNPEIKAGRDYYVFGTFEIQVTTYDLSDFNEAATLRQTVLKLVIETLIANAAFASSIATSKIGPTQFSSAKDENSGAFMSAATLLLIVEGDADQ